jgi:hypothetical protein
MKVTFPAKRQGETLALQFDFTSKLAAGQYLTSATVTVSVYSGVDPSPSLVLSGSASVAGAVATQKVTGGVAGTIYSLLCAASSSDGQTLELMGFLAITQDAV